jgi:hypothetical protein
VLAGHDHNYERFAQQTPSGALDTTNGIREFVVGTGGKEIRSFGTIKPNSEVRNADTSGVLKLTLHPSGYEWKFVPVAGKSFTDSGSGQCHGAPGDTDTVAPTVSAVAPTGGTTDVAVTANAEATFSEKMRPTSITKSTFKLLKVTSSGTTQVTNVTVTLSSDGLQATLNPYGTSSTLLAARTKYKAVVTTGAKDLAGNALDQNSTTAGNQQKSWTFTTKG